MRIWRNDVDEGAAWARVGVALIALACVALAAARVVGMLRAR